MKVRTRLNRVKWPVRVCILIAGKCEVPKIENGTLQSGFNEGSYVNHGNVLDYRCNDGFTNETSKPQCYNGTWTAIPLCVPG